MGKKRRKPYMEKPDQDIREVKYILLGVLIVGLFYFAVIPSLGQQAQPLRFIDGIIPLAYADDQVIIIEGDEIVVSQAGTGTSCPTLTGPSSATYTGTQLVHWRDSSASGCYFPIYTVDRSTTSQSLLPSFFDDFLTSFGLISDPLNVGEFTSDCRFYEVSEQGVDARLNASAGYQHIQGRTQNIAGSMGYCSSGGGNPDFVSSNLANYLDSMALNSTFFQWGINSLTDDRAPASENDVDQNTYLRMVFTNPTQLNNTVWMMQEHPKFPSSDITGGFFGIDDTTFTMDSNTVDDTEIGQVVIFKEFNKTELVGPVYDAEDRGFDGVVTMSTNYAWGQRVTIDEPFTVTNMKVFGSTGNSFFVAGTATGGTAQYFVYDPSEPAGQRYVENSTSTTAITSGNQVVDQDFAGTIVHPAGEYVFGIRFDGFTRTGSTSDGTLRCNGCTVTGGSVEVGNWKTTGFGGASGTFDYGFRVLGNGEDEFDIRVQGGIVSQTSAADQWLRIEVKDGGYGSQTLSSFPVNKYDSYNSGGSLGVVHVTPTTSVEPFDVSFSPNWSNSTEDLITVFVGIDDNSTAGSTIANITSIELKNNIKYDFDDLNDLQFYETPVEKFVSEGALEYPQLRPAANDYDAGILNMTNVTASGFTTGSLPTPASPTNGFANATSTTTIDLTWDHNLLNVTDFEVSRNGTKLVDTNNIDLNYTDSGLSPGTPYGYTVCAINGDVKESTCTTMETTTLSSPPPDTISDFDAIADETAVFLNWTKPASTPELDRYHIERNGTSLVSVEREQGWDEQGSITDLGDSIDYGPQTNEIRFRDDGKTVIISHPFNGFGNPILRQYNLTQAWNLTTAVLYKDEPLNEINNNLGGIMSAFDIKPDGTMLWATDTLSDEIFEFELTTAWDISTLSYTGNSEFYCRFTGVDAICDKSSADNIFTLRFTPDGRFIIALDQTGVLGQSGDLIKKYAMSTPYDITTLFERPQEYDLTGDANGGDVWNNMAISPNGTLLYLVSQESGSCPQQDIVQRFELTSPFNITDANKIGVGRNVCTFIDSPTGLNFKPDGTVMFVTGRDVSGGALDFTKMIGLNDVSEPRTYYDFTVEKAENYKYQIFAENTNGNGTATESNSVFTNDQPAKVTGLTAVRNTPTQIDLQWDTIPDTSGQGDPSTGVLLQEYRIFRSENGGAFEVIGVNERQSPPAIFFNDTSVNATFFYSYNVAACNELGCGNSSSSFFIASPPSKPENLTATADIADVFLDWDGNSTSDDDYRIERGNATEVGSWTLGTSIPDELDVTHNVGGGLFLSSDGNYLFVGDGLSKTVNRYTLATPFEITTGVSTQNSTDLTSTIGSKVSLLTDIHFKRDGKTMFVLDSGGNDDIYEYTLSTAWDLSTLAFNAEFTGLPSGMQGIWFTEDGERVFLTNSISDRIYKYNLTTAWDISTIVFNQFVSSGASTGPFDVIVRPDGLFLGILDIGGGLNDSVDGYNMTTAFDLTTLVGHGGVNVGQSGAYAPEPRSLFIPPDGRAVYVDQVTPDDKLFQFNLNSTLLDNFLLGEFEIIVPSLLDANVEFLNDDFSGYPDNATADLTWIPTKTGTDSADDVVGVNSTDDKIYFWTNSATGSRVQFDLQELLGKNLTDNTGLGDFNMTWTHDLSFHDGPFADTGEMKIMLIDRLGEIPSSGTHTGISVGFFQRETGFDNQALIRTAEDSDFLSFEVIDSTCSDGATTFLDTSPDDGIADGDPITVYSTLKKTGQLLEYNIGLTDDYTGLSCSMSTTATDTLDDIKYLQLARVGSGSNSEDHGWRFDDFSISTNGTLVTLYRDTDVDLGTSYTYRVTALNSTVPSEPSDPASVTTNDIPEKVIGTTASFNIPSQVDIQWDDLDFDSGIGNPSTGLNLTKYKIFRENVTGGTPFELAGEVLASSPPPNFFNDTSATFPNVFNYQVSGCNAVGCGSNSTASQTAVVSVPDPVVNHSAIAVNNTVSLDWDDANFALNYTVLRLNQVAEDLILNDTFTSDSWDDDGTNIFVDTIGQTIDWDVSDSQTNHATAYDLGSAANATNWVLRFEFNIDNLVQGSDPTAAILHLGLSDEDETVGDSGNPVDFIGLRFIVNNAQNIFQLMDADEQALGVPAADAVFTTTPSTSQTIFMEIMRTSATSYKMGLYNTDDYITPFEEVSGSTSASVDGLRYIILKNTDTGDGTEDHTSDGTIDNVLFYNSTTSSFNIIAQGVIDSDYIDSTITVNTPFTYAAYGVNDNGNGTAGVSNQVITNDFPTAPQNLTGAMGIVIPDLEDVFLDWEHPLDNGTGSPSTGVDIIHYQVERKQGVGAFSFLANTTDATPEYEDETVIAGANYTYHVRGVNALGFSPFSNTFSIITTPLMPPEAPTDLTANTLSGTEIKLDWLAAVSGDPATDYVLQQRHVGFGGFVTLATIPAPTLTYTSTGLVSGDTYDYRVRADNGAGSSPYSNIATNATYTVPGAPQNLVANTINDTAIFIDWDVPLFTNGGIIKYEIERESPENGGFAKIAEIATTENNTSSIATVFSARTSSATGASCNPPNSIFSGGDRRIIVPPLNSALYCERIAPEFDITFIPEGAIITNATLLFDVDVVNTGVRDCEFRAMDNQPELYFNNTDPTGLWNDIANGTLLFTMTECKTLMDGQSRVISASGISDLQDSLDNDDDWWAIGGMFDSEVRQSSISHQSRINQLFLDVEYINATSSPDTEYTDTGLTPKTEYNYRVNATNLIGSGPYSNEAKDTTFGVAGPPINLAFDTNGVSTITVEWDEPVNDFGSAVTGYRIDQAQDVGGTFVTVIANTGNNVEPLEETFIGLLQQTTYIYRIAAINGFGLGDFSANLTAGTFIGPSEPENFFAQFNATKPYSVFLSWETPLSDGGKPIQGYLVERKNESGTFVLIANLTSPLLLNYTDDSLLQLIEHEYRVAAYSNPVGSFTTGSTPTVVAPNFTSFVINDFDVVGDVLGQQYTIEINDCFPACTLSSADIKRNGVIESNYLVGQPLPLDTPLDFTTFFIIPVTGTQFINTSAIVTNPGTSADDEVGTVTTSLQFAVDVLSFEHNRTADFQKLDFNLTRHPIPWDATCELRGGKSSVNNTIIPVLPFGGNIEIPGNILSGPFDITATLSLQGVGFFRSPPQFDVIPSRNAYMACFDPEDIQILAFTSFGTGNGTLALTGFTDQLGTFLGVPVPFIFIIILAAIWTGRSASTGIIFLAVAIGSLGVLGYFDPLTGSPTVGDSLGYFWGFIIFLTLVGAFLGKRFF